MGTGPATTTTTTTASHSDYAMPHTASHSSSNWNGPSTGSHSYHEREWTTKNPEPMHHGLNLQNLAYLGHDGNVHSVPHMLGATAPQLQNLAWLGADGKVHTVPQSNGLHMDGMVGAPAPRMLGATAPHLQNLAYLGSDGKVHTVPNNHLEGMRGSPMLGATAPHVALVNLGLLSDLKHKAVEHGLVDQ